MAKIGQRKAVNWQWKGSERSTKGSETAIDLHDDNQRQQLVDFPQTQLAAQGT